jgi:hypothetical protein
MHFFNEKKTNKSGSLKSLESNKRGNIRVNNNKIVVMRDDRSATSLAPQ